MPSKSAAATILAMERRAYVVWLRAHRGFSYSQIALRVIRAATGGGYVDGYDGPELTDDHLPSNYNPGYAYRDMAFVLRKHAARLSEDTDILRAETAEQLDALLRLAMEKAQGGDLNGVYAALQSIQTKAKLLGLNMPEKKHIEIDGALSIEALRGAKDRADTASMEDEDDD